jgi:hypothetical protein
MQDKLLNVKIQKDYCRDAESEEGSLWKILATLLKGSNIQGCIGSFLEMPGMPPCPACHHILLEEKRGSQSLHLICS